ncbi:MAG: universal stress protein, partial [Deltaproteobacteria bacterium]|nr:universal stress protein [Deltaproteobacteria bacterium]
MSKIKKILACVDLSQYSLMTLEYAVDLAKGSQAQIIVFNVINQRDINGIDMVSGYFPGSFSNGINVEDYVKEVKKDRHGKIKAMIKENFFDEKSRMSIKIDTGI